jgi:phage FluMu protein Com
MWAKTFGWLVRAGFQADAVSCPFCNESGVSYRFVGDAEQRLGYLAIWCPRCERGCTLSRVRIPEGQPMIPFDAPDELISAEIPDYTARCE